MTNLIHQLIDLAIKEDIGSGDYSSLACIPDDAEGEAKLLVKQNGIIAGVELAKYIFYRVDQELNVNIFIKDGSIIKAGDIVLSVSGKVHAILQAERLVLNFMQRMSGIATNTRGYVDEIRDLNTIVLDTRKTTPGLREIEKMAVLVGGGNNHRMGLYDMIMLKDNHIDYAGGIEEAIRKTHDYLKKYYLDIPVEIEVRNFNELNIVLQIGNVNRIMLDNFSVEDTKKAVKLIGGKFETESSGGITFENIRNYALCGVDFISVGALTHQIKSLDLSLKAAF